MEIHWSVLEQQRSESESQRTMEKEQSTNKEKSIPEEEMKTEGERCDWELRWASVDLSKFLSSSAPPLPMGYVLT